jgi:hypothetical protein
LALGGCNEIVLSSKWRSASASMNRQTFRHGCGEAAAPLALVPDASLHISMQPYRARNPRHSPLWQCARRHFATFLEIYPHDYQPRLGPLRPVIPQVVHKFLDCGLPAGRQAISTAASPASAATIAGTNTCWPSRARAAGSAPPATCLRRSLSACGHAQAGGTFHPLPPLPLKPLEELFRAHVLTLLVALRLLPPDRVQVLLSWKHSGFNLHHADPVPPENKAELEQLAQYILRNPLSVEKMTMESPGDTVIYRSRLSLRVEG